MPSDGNNPNKGINTRAYLLMVAAAFFLLVIVAFFVVGKSSNHIVPRATVPPRASGTSPQ
jgi:hypothetical protein